MNRQITKRIQADALKALQKVADKHGLKLTPGKGQFDEEHCALKFEFAHMVGNGDSLKTTGDWETLIEGTKLEGKKLGIKFRANGTTYTVTGVHLNRPVWPISGKGPRGGAYRFKLSHVENGLI
jgi:hypothetical protein